MNERIKLPAQEWLGYDPERGDIHGYTFEQMREFAQLLIQECIDQIGDYTTDIQVGTEYNTSLQKDVPVFRIVDAETTLRQYFRVKL